MVVQKESIDAQNAGLIKLHMERVEQCLGKLNGWCVCGGPVGYTNCCPDCKTTFDPS